MSIADEITFEHLSLGNLTHLIKQNINACKAMNVKMFWGFIKGGGGNMYGRIFDGDELLFQKYYSGKFTHILLAMMH